MSSTISFEFRRTGPQEFQWEVSFDNDRDGCNFEVIFAVDAVRTLFSQTGKNQHTVKGSGIWRNEEGLNLDAYDGHISLVAFAKVNWPKGDGTYSYEQPHARGYLKVGQGQTFVAASDEANEAIHN